ncbi:MAG: methylenetetrahydrofolate reductase [Neomegalonema sp.]|nr:methylenetetrahydrofolate reductase [Neomegalonema sp.]
MPTSSAPEISFEFFPPATPEMAYKLWSTAQGLGPLGPRFVSVTYGAGGSTRRRTLDAIQALHRTAKLDVAGHLTCVGATREETLEVARQYKQLGVCRIVALRGDMPVAKGEAPKPFAPHPGGFESSVELIAALEKEIGLPIAVAAYPEPHPDALDPRSCIDHLKAKFDAGGDLGITQFFFSNEDYFRLLDEAEKAGITQPILPGILPIENIARLQRFAARCGASVPQALVERFNALPDGADAKKLAREICTEQCAALQAQGINRLHFYTLNDPEITYGVCRDLGVQDAAETSESAVQTR